MVVLVAFATRHGATAGIAELTPLLRARGERVFFGSYDPDARPETIGEHMVALLPNARAALPAGDFRDWSAIDAWAGEIAAALAADVSRA